MPHYSVSNRTTSTTTGTAALEIIAPPEGTFVTLIHITLATATASTFGIGRSSAVGITPTSPVPFVAHDMGRPTTTTATALAWATPPTEPATYLRRVTLPATVGAIVVFDFFPQPIGLAAGESLVVWNLGTTAVADVNVTCDEDWQQPISSNYTLLS